MALFAAVTPLCSKKCPSPILVPFLFISRVRPNCERQSNSARASLTTPGI
jgi:hypothetical protein